VNPLGKRKLTQIDLNNLDFCDSIEIANDFQHLYKDNSIQFDRFFEEITFLDALATAYANVYRHEKRDFYCSSDPNVYLPILCATKALDLYFRDSDEWDKNHETLLRLYVNLGNYHTDQYRYCEAMEFYNQAMHIDPEYGMAILAKNFCIEENPCLLRFCSINKIFNYLLYNYKRIIISDFDDENRNLRKLVDLKIQRFESSRNNFKNVTFSRANSAMVFGYYLNPIDDLSVFDNCVQDKIVKPCTGYPKLVELYSDFIFIRNHLKKDVYSIEEEKRFLMMKFSRLFSFFDKVAFFLNNFFLLGVKEDDVTMTKIWSVNDMELLQYKNPYLYAIYWITAEYREYRKKKSCNEYIPEKYRRIEEYRNSFEHRIPVLEELDLSDFRDSTLKLESIARNMLIYLQMMVIVETDLGHQQNANRSKNSIYSPSFFPGIFWI
jgi:hypothetical protein